MAQLQVLPRSQTKLISQQRLRMLRELRQKQDELFKLETRLAEKILDDLASGAEVEEGPYKMRIKVVQRGNRREKRLIVY